MQDTQQVQPKTQRRARTVARSVNERHVVSLFWYNNTALVIIIYAQLVVPQKSKKNKEKKVIIKTQDKTVLQLTVFSRYYRSKQAENCPEIHRSPRVFLEKCYKVGIFPFLKITMFNFAPREKLKCDLTIISSSAAVFFDDATHTFLFSLFITFMLIHSTP